MKNLTKDATMLLFIILLVFPVLFINVKQGNISQLEQRYLAPFPTVFNTEGSLATDLRRTFETWLNDNLGFRELFVRAYSNLQYKVLGRSPNTTVEIGSDGWFFYTKDRNIQIASGNYVFTEQQLQEILQQQHEIKNRLSAQEVDYAFVLPTSKVSVYPEYIRSGDYNIRKTPVDQIEEYIKSNSDILVVGLKNVLLAEKKESLVYLKTDTHWNEYGAYIGYKEIIRKFNDHGLLDEELEEVSFIQSEYKGEFSALMGNSELLTPEQTSKSIIKKQDAYKVLQGELFEKYRSLLEKYQVKNPCFLYFNETKEGTAIMFGDSMFGSWNATELLAEHYGMFVYVWGGDIQQEYIDLFEPNIVIYEIAERYLDQITQKNKLFSISLEDYNAEIISYDTPLMVESGRLNHVKVAVQNTSNSVWCEKDLVRLCVWVDSVDSGVRAMLPSDVMVLPNEIVEFEINDLFLPKEVGCVEFQMLQEGIIYFGERKMVYNKN